jgi:hypothetical protein
MAKAGYPGVVWDGDSQNRNSDDAPQMAPDWRDWERMIAELAAVQGGAQGYDPDNPLNSYGVVETVTGLSVAERGNAAMHKTIITLNQMSVASADGSTPATDAAWGSQKLYTFPQGHIIIHGTHHVYPLAGIAAVTGGGGGFSDTANLEAGVGTVARANASNFALQTAEEDICTGVDVDLTAKTSDAIESAALSTALYKDGSTAAIAAYLNFCTLADGDHGPTADVLLFSGTLTILWSMLGDD